MNTVKYIATVGEEQEHSGRGESWSDSEEFGTLKEAREYVMESMREIIGFRIESGETDVAGTEGYKLHGPDGDGTLEQLENWLDELDALDGEIFSFFWSIEKREQ
jgi:hypothetical protein